MTVSADPAVRPRLSVAMIVRDAEEVLAASIESVRSIADEIFVLDTGSTDRTVELIEQLGATGGRMAWTDDFSAARNHCLRQVTGDWVLWLDAGERLDADSAAQLRQFVDRAADRQKVYMLLVEVPPADPSASGEQATRRRLMPNRADLRFQHRLRETLQPSIEAAGLQTDSAPGRIVRHRRHNDPAVKTLRANRDLTLIALEAAQQSELPPPLLLARAEAYGDLGIMHRAREAFLETLESAGRGSTEMLEAYYGLLTTYDNDPTLQSQQLTVCLEALETFPLDAQLLLAMGNYLQGQQRLDLAVRSFETAVRYGKVDPEAWHLCSLAEVAAVCLSLALQMQQSDEDARRVLEEALAANADSIRLKRHLLDLHIKHGRCDEAIALAGRLPTDPDQREPLLAAVRGACRAVKKDWTAALGHLQQAYVTGCRDPLCLRWLSVTLLSNGQVEAAEPVLSEWREIDPANVELQAYLAVVERHRRAAVAETEQPQVPAADDSAGRKFRLDQGTSVLKTPGPVSPPVGETPPVDPMAELNG